MKGDAMGIEDPKDLERADRDIHLSEMRDQVDKLSGGEELTFVNPDCPPEVEERFLQNILDYERAPMTSDFERLRGEGVALPEPSELSDDVLPAKLWEIIESLARRNTFLSNTDHLSDRQLYEHLWSETLHEAGPDLPPGSGWVSHIDILGSGSEEDILLHLKYYADDEDRAFWAKEWPDMAIPAHEDPPYDRDSRLPQPPDERMMAEDGEEPPEDARPEDGSGEG
jgi:hypothetical protein